MPKFRDSQHGIAKIVLFVVTAIITLLLLGLITKVVFGIVLLPLKLLSWVFSLLYHHPLLCVSTAIVVWIVIQKRR